jgi:hypothetical protein
MTHNLEDYLLPTLIPCTKENAAAPTNNGTAAHDVSHNLSTDFDAIAQQLFDEMGKPEGDGNKKLFSEKYLLAAILLQGAQPVVH